jgi:exosortase D (VPLPA-CTERM-specific)
MSTNSLAGSPPITARISFSAVGWMLLAFISTVFFFSEGLLELLNVWQLPEYSHGPIIPVLSSIMFLREMRMVPPQAGPIEDRWPGFWVLVVALLVGFIGKLTRFPEPVAYMTILWIAGMVMITFGWRRGRIFWPSILHLTFMLPLPGVLYYTISTELQAFSAQFGIFIVRSFGVHAFLDGNVIDLGSYKLLVAEACSGLRYLFPIMSFSYVFAVLYRGPAWHKATLLISAAPLAIFMNALRIGILGVIVEYVGISYAEGLTHFMEGWVIFISCVAILFGIAWALLRLQPEKMTLTEALDLDMSGLVEQARRARFVYPSRALAAAAIVTATAAAAWEAAPERAFHEIDREPLVFFPRSLDDGWRAGAAKMLDPSIAAALGADDYVSLVFTKDGASAEFFAAWYQDQTRGGAHSPQICLPGGGWEIAEIDVVDASGGADIDGPFWVNRVLIQKGLDLMLVYYWYEIYGGPIARDYVAKAALLRDGVLYGRTDGGLLRLTTPVSPTEGVEVAEARLQSLLAGVRESLPRFVPTHATDGAR